ncbi:hypothetical protein [Streptomyces sirii]|uniref:hypothetical protein n=1 Tax=Streptomyces sirii TaxID=3127701 RepID=UPI003D36E17F
MRMRTFVAGQEAYSELEFAELALGIDRELFLSPFAPETADERAARLDAAADILADLRQQGERGDEIAAWDALYADALTAVAPLRRVRRVRRSAGTGRRHEPGTDDAGGRSAACGRMVPALPAASPAHRGGP